MNKKSIVVIPLLIFISLSIFASISFAEDNRSYSIPFADIHLYIQDDGNLHVVEKIHYSFSGTWNGLKRNIPFSSDETIDNLNVTTEGAYSKFMSKDENGEKVITTYIFSDPEMKNPVTDTDVVVTYEYDFINVLKVYNDGATLHYTLWGDEWDRAVGKLNAYVHTDNKTDVKYWLNPSEIVSNSKWDNNTLEASTDTIYSGDLFELRMILPKNYFNNPTYALKFNSNGVADFENLQKDYENGVAFFSVFYTVLSFLFLGLCFIPIIIYLKYGREPKLTYHGIYEHEPPTDDSPANVNSLYKGSVGRVDMDAFKATILSLVNKKYLTLDGFESSDNNITKSETAKQPAIVFAAGQSLAELSSSEKSAFKVLKLFSGSGNKLYLDAFKSDMENKTSAKRFKESYDAWTKRVQEDSKAGIENLFNSNGYDYSRYLGIMGLIISILYLGLLIFGYIPYSFVSSASLLILPSILLLIVSIILFVLPNHIMGHWTVSGRENRKKWENFKKYLKSFSLIKERPPSSIVIWNDYLVYATALGIAKSVQKSMQKLIPQEVLDDNDSYMFYRYGGSAALFSSFDSGISTANSSDSDSGGNGGFGGGSGGGGGGAF